MSVESNIIVYFCQVCEFRLRVSLASTCVMTRRFAVNVCIKLAAVCHGGCYVAWGMARRNKETVLVRKRVTCDGKRNINCIYDEDIYLYQRGKERCHGCDVWTFSSKMNQKQEFPRM